MNKVKDFFRNIKRWCINVYAFRKTLWNGRPWDCTLLYMAMVDSLASMEADHIECSHLVNNEKYAKQMRTTRLILERLIKDEYMMENIKHVPSKEPGQYIRLGTFVPKNDVAPSCKYAFTVAQNAQKNDLRLLAKMIEKHSLGWWV